MNSKFLRQISLQENFCILLAKVVRHIFTIDTFLVTMYIMSPENSEVEERHRQLKKESSSIRNKTKQQVEIGKPIIAQSNLRSEFEGTPITEADVETATQLMMALTSDTKQVGTRKHLLISKTCAGLIVKQLKEANPEGQKIAQLDPNAIEIAAVLHDIDRTVTNRYGISGFLLRKLGVRKDIVDLIPSIQPYIRPKKLAQSFSDLSLPQIILDIADLHSKPRYGKNENQSWVLSFNETLGYHRNSRAKYVDITKLQPVYPIEENAFKNMVEGIGIIEHSARIYTEAEAWLRSMGVNFETIHQILEKEEEERGVILENYSTRRE